MKIAIVTNMNGIGLQREFELLADFLGRRGHDVQGIQYDAPPDDPATVELLAKRFDLSIFLEVIPRNMLELAPVKWAFLNPEWCKPDILKTAQRHMDKIFAKTQEALRIFLPLFPGKAFYTGFLTRDQNDPETKREPWFLHIGGNSSLRGTQAVLDAWKWSCYGKRLDAHLWIISSALQERVDIPNVHIFERVTEEQLKLMQNQCKFHLYPSATEGFGHALHEARSVGAVIVTTDAPPMNELDLVYHIPGKKAGKYNLADLYEVDARNIQAAACELVAITTPEMLEAPQFRNLFDKGNAEFERLFEYQLKQFDKKKTAPYVKPKGSGLQIAFIGNFKPSESTENMIKWALEEGLGHDVETLQENEVNAAAIRTSMEHSDLLLWVRTPSWLRVHDTEMLEIVKASKIPSISVHLDKFWGIPAREQEIGRYPFWHSRFVFTADGSRQEGFKARGVNHYWMRPAVSEVYCHPGQPWDMYRCDVGFVGAKEYHSEYPFRKQLVEFLEQTYGERFKHITGLRGHGLNDFYASCKVVVGDCIFAGTPNYWSDRLPETVGRHGFLLHPSVEGLDIPVICYKPQDLEDLGRAIESTLQYKDRRDIIKTGVAKVLKNDTWTVRMKEILDIVL